MRRMPFLVLAKGPVIYGVCHMPKSAVSRLSSLECNWILAITEPDHGEVASTFLKRRSQQLGDESEGRPRPDRPGRNPRLQRSRHWRLLRATWSLNCGDDSERLATLSAS